MAISEDRLEAENSNFPTEKKLLNKPQNDDFELNQEIEFIPLGNGKIVNIDRQPTLTKGKYNLIIEANLEIGQSILVFKLFNAPDYSDKTNETNTNETETLLQLAEEKLKPRTLEKLKKYLVKQKKLPKGQLEVLLTILKNEE